MKRVTSGSDHIAKSIGKVVQPMSAQDEAFGANSGWHGGFSLMRSLYSFAESRCP